ncbi:helix-turn-helix domain-containing protein [Rhizobium sp. CAU 1783]
MQVSLEKIDTMRERLGVAQVDLCRRADVSESTLSRARKTGRPPTGRILRKLSSALEAIQRERGIAIVDEAGQ